MNVVGKAINEILQNGATNLPAQPDFAQNDFADTYIVYRVVNITPSDTKSGASTLDEVNIEINIYSNVLATVADLSVKVRADLDRVAHGSYAGVTLQGVQFTDEDTGYDYFSRRYECQHTYTFRVER